MFPVYNNQNNLPLKEEKQESGTHPIRVLVCVICLLCGNMFIKPFMIGDFSYQVNSSAMGMSTTRNTVSGILPDLSNSSLTVLKDTGFAASHTKIFQVSTECITGNWLGTTSADWNDESNWCGGIPLPTTDVVILTGGNQPEIGVEGGFCHNLLIDTGATLIISGTNSLTISGNCTNTGTFIPNNSTVIFNGGTIQNLEVNSTAAFHNLTVDNSSAVRIIGTASVIHIIVNGDLTINSGSLAVGAKNQLTVIGAINNLTGNQGLVLHSDNQGSASLIHNTNNVPATIQIYTGESAEAWHLLSSPVASQKISGDWMPGGTYGGAGGTGYDMYLWDEPTGCWKYRLNAKWDSLNSGSNNFRVGRGYLYSVQATNQTKSFAGNLNNGVLNYPLKNSGKDLAIKGFNLVGNPYPSSIDWQSSEGWSRSDLFASSGGYDIWIWNQGAANYGTFNSSTGVGTNSVTGYIPSMQGFFVRAASAGNLGFSNDVRVHDANTVWKDNRIPPAAISITVQGDQDKMSDEVKLLFGYPDNEGGTTKLFSPVIGAPGLWLKSGDECYTVRYLNNFQSNQEVQVHFKPGSSGNYTLNVNFNSEDFPCVFLEDIEEKNIQDLRVQKNYRFTTSVSEQANRFIVHFGSPQISAGNELPAKIILTNSQIQVDLSKVTGNTLVSIYDMMGRKLYEQQLAGEMAHSLPSISGNKFMIIKLQNTYGQMIRKVLISDTNL